MLITSSPAGPTTPLMMGGCERSESSGVVAVAGAVVAVPVMWLARAAADGGLRITALRHRGSLLIVLVRSSMHRRDVARQIPCCLSALREWAPSISPYLDYLPAAQ
jgi:hypothetical protein